MLGYETAIANISPERFLTYSAQDKVSLFIITDIHCSSTRYITLKPATFGMVWQWTRLSWDLPHTVEVLWHDTLLRYAFIGRKDLGTPTTPQ